MKYIFNTFFKKNQQYNFGYHYKFSIKKLFQYSSSNTHKFNIILLCYSNVIFIFFTLTNKNAQLKLVVKGKKVTKKQKSIIYMQYYKASEVLCDSLNEIQCTFKNKINKM